MLRKKTIVCTLVLAMFAGTAGAASLSEKLQELAQNKIQDLVNNPEVIKSINEQNARNAAFTQADIDKLDKQWRAETKSSGGELISNTLATPLSAYLKKLKSDEQGLFTEIFVMDNRGLNVGQSDMTSDYWQGDEAKWKQTFLVGSKAVHISAVEFDESSQTYQAQVSVAISDPQTQAVIGAATFGVNAEAIQ